MGRWDARGTRESGERHESGADETHCIRTVPQLD
jgi:hypothetical protein